MRKDKGEYIGGKMFIKIYHYHIQAEKVEEFLELQKKVIEIYRKYIDFKIVYIKSKDDETKWYEIAEYNDEVEYEKSIISINEEDELQQLYHTFQSLLVKDKMEIIEESFYKILTIDTCYEKNE